MSSYRTNPDFALNKQSKQYRDLTRKAATLEAQKRFGRRALAWTNWRTGVRYVGQQVPSVKILGMGDTYREALADATARRLV
jgi:hypothetical protein